MATLNVEAPNAALARWYDSVHPGNSDDAATKKAWIEAQLKDFLRGEVRIAETRLAEANIEANLKTTMGE